MTPAEERSLTVFRLVSHIRVLMGLALLLFAAGVAAQAVQESVNEALSEVVDATLQRADAVVSRYRSVDAYRHGFGEEDSKPLQTRLPIEMRRELDKLRYAYNRNLERMLGNLRHELTRLAAAFRRDTDRQGEVAQVLERRAVLEAAVDESWQTFRAAVDAENERASERRELIIAPLLEE